jgi:hypothetical protein
LASKATAAAARLASWLPANGFTSPTPNDPSPSSIPTLKVTTNSLRIPGLNPARHPPRRACAPRGSGWLWPRPASTLWFIDERLMIATYPPPGALRVSVHGDDVYGRSVAAPRQRQPNDRPGEPMAAAP